MLQKFREKLHNTERGAIMVFFAILVPLFLGMIGFAVDAGFLYMQKAKLQDIADAAALAGAGHLNDTSNNDSYPNVNKSVGGFVAFNGFDAEGTSKQYYYYNEYKSDEYVTEELKKSKSDKWKVAMKVLPKVMDKDDVQRDHVRVFIVKKVPTFFIRMLFPDQKEVVVSAAAEAEYVAGSEPVVAYDDPVIMSPSYDSGNLNSSDSIVVKKGQDFSIYAPSSDIPFDKLPTGAVGTVYHAPHNAGSAPEGWKVVRANNTYWDESSKKEKEALDKAEARYKELTSEARAFHEDRKAHIDEYIHPVEGSKKRFIGFDKSGNFVNNIKENSDNEIELYMNGTDGKWKRSDKSFLVDFELRGVKKVNTLIMESWGIIDTDGVTYGDIYTSGLQIGGKNNNFNGMVYSNGWGEFNIGGINNHFLCTGKTSVLNEGATMKIGKWPILKLLYDNGEVYVAESWDYGYADASWQIFFDGSSTGNGSSNSGSSSDSSGSTNAHVRLVK